MSEGDAAAIFWGGLIFALLGVAGCIARVAWGVQFPFGVGVMAIGIGATMVFIDSIATRAGIPGVIASLSAATLAAWWVSSTSMGRDQMRRLRSELRASE